MRSKYLAAMLIAAGLPAVSVAAEEGTSEASKWSGDVSVGLLFKRGNTESDSVNAHANASRDSAFWRHHFKADANNEKERDQETDEYNRTDENYFASYKLDRKLGEESRNYLFNVVTYEKDNFSGFHYQASYAVGLGRRVIDREAHTLDVEAGPGYRVQCLEPEDSYSDCADTEESAIARLALKYHWQISENAEFQEEISSEVGEESTSTRMETSLTSKINSHFALRLRHLLEHESKVPAGSKETDHQVSVGLVYTFK